MEKLARNKPLFIGLSCLSVGCLVGAFGYPLQRLEIYAQQEKGSFNYSYEKRFILTESDTNYPYGFDQSRAVKIAQVYNAYAPQKFMFLILSSVCAGYALLIGGKTVIDSEIDSEVELIQATGKKQLLLEKVKHRLALASKSQRLLFIEEMKSLMEEFGSPEQELIEADEINALYDEVAEKDVSDSTSSDDLLTEEIRKHFPENLDATCWSAISKALANKATKEEILTEVLQANNDIGRAYLALLNRKYLGWLGIVCG